jgi:hypothetical protein
MNTWGPHMPSHFQPQNHYGHTMGAQAGNKIIIVTYVVAHRIRKREIDQL